MIDKSDISKNELKFKIKTFVYMRDYSIILDNINYLLQQNYPSVPTLCNFKTRLWYRDEAYCRFSVQISYMISERFVTIYYVHFRCVADNFLKIFRHRVRSVTHFGVGINSEITGNITPQSIFWCLSWIRNHTVLRSAKSYSLRRINLKRHMNTLEWK